MYYGDELYHHGRFGQRWGVTNGPPYPLSRSVVRSAYGKRKMQKAAEKQAKVEREEAARKEAEEKERQRKAADKERVLREGSASEILKYKNELTTAEIENAIKRIEKTRKLIELSNSELEKGWKAVDDVMQKVGNIRDWTKISAELMENINKIKKNL